MKGQEHLLAMNRIEELNRLLSFDSETGLPNKNKCMRDVLELKEGAVFFISVRNFTDINSAYGREIGDRMIVRIANALRGLEDAFGMQLYKFSGTEYALIGNRETILERALIACPARSGDNCGACDTCKWKTVLSEGQDKEDGNFPCSMRAIADKIQTFLRIIDIPINGHAIHINFSVGGAYGSARDVIHSAQIANKECSIVGKPVIYDGVLGQRVMEEHNRNFEWIDRLKRAIQEGGIVPYFQGIRDNSTGEIHKFEALARMELGDQTFAPYLFL